MKEMLFTPLNVGDISLANRVVMAPLTRSRADENRTLHDLNVTYYQQRATAGLIITEATQISAEAAGYPATPGLYNDLQVAAWKRVTDAVHAEGGRIFVQLWHCGRISHPSLLPDSQPPVAPSAIAAEGEAFTYEGPKPFVVPKILSVDEIAVIVGQFQEAAKRALQAGFDGIELHGANGYLIDQFLRDGSNQRDDLYGGSVENRGRFLCEVIEAVCAVLPSKQVGLRLSPENRFNSMSDSDPQSHFSYFVSQLNAYDLAYLHVLEGDMTGRESRVDYRVLRDSYQGTYMANNGYDKAKAEQALQAGHCDLVAFGVPFIANPDLVYRYQHDLPLNEADPNTFYGGDEHGYTDYPFASR